MRQLRIGPVSFIVGRSGRLRRALIPIHPFLVPAKGFCRLNLLVA